MSKELPSNRSKQIVRKMTDLRSTIRKREERGLSAETQRRHWDQLLQDLKSEVIESEKRMKNE